MPRDRLFLFLAGLATVTPLSVTAPKTNVVDLRLNLETWIHPFKTGDTWTLARFEQKIPSNQAAIIICDMWDKHWCRGATNRVEALARKMEPVLERARAKSILIIHAPSETMAYYANAP